MVLQVIIQITSSSIGTLSNRYDHRFITPNLKQSDNHSVIYSSTMVLNDALMMSAER